MEIRVRTSLILWDVLAKALCHFTCGLRSRIGLVKIATFVRRCPSAFSSALLDM